MPRAEPPLSSCADSRRVGNSEMSAPATNARSPAPLTTIARISSSVSSRASSASSSSSSGADRALTGGWSIVTTATAPSTSLEMNSPNLGRLRRLRACELLAERRLPELADRRLRDLFDELEPVGEPPLREVRGEELAQLLVRRLGALLQHDDRERPLGPLVVRDGDDRRLGDRLVPHERVLERDRGDPLAARLDEVLRAILHLDEAVRVDAHDVAGPEPAVVRPSARHVLVGLVVGGCDRRAAHLELAHRLAVPRDEPFGATSTDLDERDREPLQRAPGVRLVLRQARLLPRRTRDRPHRAHLGHAPAVDDVQAVP